MIQMSISTKNHETRNMRFLYYVKWINTESGVTRCEVFVRSMFNYHLKFRKTSRLQSRLWNKRYRDPARKLYWNSQPIGILPTAVGLRRWVSNVPSSPSPMRHRHLLHISNTHFASQPYIEAHIFSRPPTAVKASYTCHAMRA